MQGGRVSLSEGVAVHRSPDRKESAPGAGYAPPDRAGAICAVLFLLKRRDQAARSQMKLEGQRRIRCSYLSLELLLKTLQQIYSCVQLATFKRRGCRLKRSLKRSFVPPPEIRPFHSCRNFGHCVRWSDDFEFYSVRIFLEPVANGQRHAVNPQIE